MKLLKYSEFILEEAKNEILVPLVISPAFFDKVYRIESPISKSLLSKGRMVKYTYIDLGDSPNMVKYTEGYKAYEYTKNDISSNREESIISYIKDYKPPVSDNLWSVNRVEINIGRFIKKLFDNEFKDSEIEKFVNQWKALNDNVNFELWEGYKILDGYKSNNYHFSESNYNPLMNSCMNDNLSYLSIYKYCKGLNLLVLLDDSGHILGRALIWTDYQNRKIMDRVYYVYDKDYYKFTLYAKNNDIYYKSKNISGDYPFVFKNKEYDLNTKIYCSYFDENDEFPYMDTFYYYQNGWVMNYKPETGPYYELKDVDGCYYPHSNVFDSNGREINEDF